MRQLLPVFVVLAVLVLVALAVAAGIVFWMSGSTHAAVGTILVYEVAPQAGGGAAAASVDLKQLAAAMDRRVNSGWSSNARVSVADDGRIEVGVFGTDPGRVDRIDRILTSEGTLEFRVLANPQAPEHQALIELAKTQDGPAIRSPGGDVLGWWVPIDPAQQAGLQSLVAQMVTRSKAQGASSSLEVLVASDVFNVTGAYLKSAVPDVDERGSPCLQIVFDARGGQLFAGLTGANLPSPIGEFGFQLGIILDGRLISAPRIMTTISSRAVITGSYTREEVEDLAQTLSGGSLPARILKVERRRPLGATRP